MTFLEAAEAALRHAGKPQHVEAIADWALKSGSLQTDGKTPSATMGAMLAMAQKKKGDASLFVRTAPSTYGLREWLDTGEIQAQASSPTDTKGVRVPGFPSYEKVRAALTLLDGATAKTFTGMNSSVHSQMGNPKVNKDWSDPDTWIPLCLEGEHAKLALRLWTGSGHILNPRHLRETWLLVRHYDLLDEDPNGVLTLGPRGRAFLEESGSEVEREIDEREGVFKILSLVSELGPVRKAGVIGPWREYLFEVSNIRSDSSSYMTLYSRLRNLRDRGYVELKGVSYSVTDTGLKWLDDADLDDAISGTDVYQDIVTLARSQKDQIRDTVHEMLCEMDPYEFEKVVARLLIEMEYDDVYVTPPGGDHGVDVVATMEFGITKVKEVVQVKRAGKKDKNVQRPVLDRLRGVLSKFQAGRGTIVTTGGFSSGTIEAANEFGAPPITLIDGPKLVELLIEHGIGVRKKPIELWELDASAFSGEDEDGSDVSS